MQLNADICFNSKLNGANNRRNISSKNQSKRFFSFSLGQNHKHDPVDDWYRYDPYTNEHGKFRHKAEEVENYCKPLVNAKFEKYKDEYLGYPHNKLDLYQDMRTRVWEVIKENPNKPMSEIKPLSWHRTEWRLIDLLREAIRKSSIEKNVYIPIDCNDDEEYMSAKSVKKIEFKYPEELITVISGVLDEESCDILKRKHFQGQSDLEIAKFYGYARSTITKKLSRIYKKIRKERPELKDFKK